MCIFIVNAHPVSFCAPIATTTTVCFVFDFLMNTISLYLFIHVLFNENTKFSNHFYSNWKFISFSLFFQMSNLCNCKTKHTKTKTSNRKPKQKKNTNTQTHIVHKTNRLVRAARKNQFPLPVLPTATDSIRRNRLSKAWRRLTQSCRCRRCCHHQCLNDVDR